jgi:hypothetical protein
VKNVPLLTLVRSDPAPDDVRAALERLCASPPFRNSRQLTAFLRYIVEAVLNGQSDTIKAYTIAVDALGRPEDFDPVGDAIVRVEARRLRHALGQYYRGDGGEDPISISMLRGSYVPRFGWRAGTADLNLVPGPAVDSFLSNVDPVLARTVTALADGHMTLLRHQFLLARCHRDLAALAHDTAHLRNHVERSKLLIVQSQSLIQFSRQPPLTIE